MPPRSDPHQHEDQHCRCQKKPCNRFHARELSTHGFIERSKGAALRVSLSRAPARPRSALRAEPPQELAARLRELPDFYQVKHCRVVARTIAQAQAREAQRISPEGRKPPP